MKIPFFHRKKEDPPAPIKTTTASLFNLLVYTHNPKKIDYFRELVDTIISKFPCKVIFVLGNTENKEDAFHVEKSIKVSGSIACEHIEIKAGGTHLLQVPYYILPHLAPDLPIYLIWGQDPTEENEVLPRLIEYADRLIFDSEAAQDLTQFASRFLKQRKRFPCEVLDMSWARSTGWRNVIAGAMDTKEKIEVLREGKALRIGYNNIQCSATSNPATQAKFFQAWLASRLGWKASSGTNGAIEVEIFPQESVSNTPGAILTVILEGPEGEELKLHRSSSILNQVSVAYSTQEECLLPYTIPFQTHSRGLTFVREILFVSPSAHYLEMLRTIARDHE